MTLLEREQFKKKFGWNGKNFSDLFRKVLAKHTDEIARKSIQIDERNARSIIPKRAVQNVRMPDAGKLVKAQVLRGEGRWVNLSKAMREQMRKDVQAGLMAHGITTTRGTVPKRAITTIRNNLQKTFAGYARGDAPNLKAVAITETRTIVNACRASYASELSNSVPDHDMEKRWVHNPGSAVPRQPHLRAASGPWIPVHDKFKVDGPNGVEFCDHPHDPHLSAEQSINCRCEAVYRFVRRKTQQAT